MIRKTKIVCTLGPASDNDEMVSRLMDEGMNVCRLNMSHGSYEEQAERIQRIKRLREEKGIPVGILLDTKGPEVRTKTLAAGKVELEAGQEFVLTSREVEGNEHEVSITYPRMAELVRPGVRVLIDDGLLAMNVVRVENGTDIVCCVINGGTLGGRKGISVPDVDLQMPSIGEKDRADILFGIEQGIDMIAASFVCRASDVLTIRKLCDDNNGSHVKIYSKIENRMGVDNFDDILKVSDGIMVARGDMGVEIPFEMIPSIQKKIIQKAYRAGKQVITATQMLESMITNPRPTRAEITDVANAIYDGTSAIMLSGETAAGAHPVESVETMSRIAETTEGQIDYVTHFNNAAAEANRRITDAISHATVTTAHDLGAKAIITVTKSGSTARMISKHRPQCMIIGCTTDETVCRQMNLSWGVVPLLCDEKKNTDELFSHAVEVARKNELVTAGDVVVITAGIPLGISGTTNMLKVEKL